MRQRSLGLTVFAGLAIIVSACGGGATPSPSASARRLSHRCLRRPRLRRLRRAPQDRGALVRAAQGGVVTDVGQLEDKTFNQSSNEGAQAAAAIGGSTTSSSPSSISDYAREHPDLRRPGLRRHRDLRLHIGTTPSRPPRPTRTSSSSASTRASASTRTATRTATFACKGDAATLLPNYQGIVFARDAGRATSPASSPPASPRTARSAPSAARHCPGRASTTSQRLRERREVGQGGHQGPLTYVTDRTPKALQRPGRGQGVRRAVPRQNPARRPLPGRGPDRQRRPRGRLRRNILASASTSTSSCRPPTVDKCILDQRREEPQRGWSRADPSADRRGTPWPARPLRCDDTDGDRSVAVSRQLGDLFTPDIQSKIDAALDGHDGRGARALLADKCATSAR